jgi:hypothetical protein
VISLAKTDRDRTRAWRALSDRKGNLASVLIRDNQLQRVFTLLEEAMQVENHSYSAESDITRV